MQQAAISHLLHFLQCFAPPDAPGTAAATVTVVRTGFTAAARLLLILALSGEQINCKHQNHHNTGKDQ